MVCDLLMAHSAGWGRGPTGPAGGTVGDERTIEGVSSALEAACGGGSLPATALASRRFARHMSKVPTMPLGSRSVVATNRPPSTNSHMSGSAAVNQLLPAFTRSAPTMGPTIVPRPPTAVQITTSIELAGANSPGLM